MNYDELLNLYNNNEFREIDKDLNREKFYLLRSISKGVTLKKFCNEYNLCNDLNKILVNDDITVAKIIEFIVQEYHPRDDINKIEEELNKMQNFDWGGSYGNSLEKNIVSIIKKTLSFSAIENAILGRINESVRGYTLNSWYNHWTSIMLEEIFNLHPKVIPTIDRVKSIDFFVDGIPFDLKVTYFPEELMKKEISGKLKEKYGKSSELLCFKKIAKELNIVVPSDLKERSLVICLQNLLMESIEPKAEEFLKTIANIKNEVINYYRENPNDLIIWLYENQGEMRFDAANRFYVVLVNSDNIFDSWKLKRNRNLLSKKINERLDHFSNTKLNEIRFTWSKSGKEYSCFSELIFMIK